jgi:hypothetical protein
LLFGFSFVFFNLSIMALSLFWLATSAGQLPELALGKWDAATRRVWLLDVSILTILAFVGIVWIGRGASAYGAGGVAVLLTVFYYGVLKGVFYVDVLYTFPCSQPLEECYFMISAVLAVRAVIVSMWMGFAAVIVTTIRNVRRSVRAKYGIPANGQLECCISLVCPCLTVAQLLRQTTDYGTVEATFCSWDGIRGKVSREIDMGGPCTEQK